MVKLFSVAEMISLEKEANTAGLSYENMMENAGKGIANEIEITYSHVSNKKIVALIGSGNNGSDALIALSYLSSQNWETYAYIVRNRDDHDPLIRRLISNHGNLVNLENDSNCEQLSHLLETSSILIDGVFGTGIKLPLKGETAKVLEFVRKYIINNPVDLHVVAVDCPSGVDCDTGKVATETIPAELTITMAGMKHGLIRFPAASLTGEIHFVSIGNIENLSAYKKNNKFVLSAETVKGYLPKRPLDAHKGTFGTAFIIAGSVNFTGAALLAGLAAYRIGTGLVTLAVPTPLYETLAGQFPESTWVLLPDEIGVIAANAAQVVSRSISRVSSILIGPGLGLEDTTREFIRRFLLMSIEWKKGNIGFLSDENKKNDKKEIKAPMVVDADGLKLISKIDNWTSLLPPRTILTPHSGEMSIMTGISTEEIQENRIEIAKQYASKWGHIIVLKGAYTVIAEPEGGIAVVPVATPALAKAGTGDVLAGLITGLRAQGVQPFQAACAGAWIHAQAGLLAAKRLGNTASVIATDVLNAVPQVMSELN